MTAVRRLATAGRLGNARAVPGHQSSPGRPSGLSVGTAQPYPWPYDGAALPAATALLVVAAQRAVASHCPSASSASAAIGNLAAALRLWGAHVVWTRHARPPGPQAGQRPSLLPPAHGPERGPVGRQPSDLVAHAYGWDGFSASPLAEGLHGRGVTHLLLAGFGLEGPVHSTLRSANDRGWECLIVADACAPFDPTMAAPALSTVETWGGALGATASSADVLAALDSGDSREPARPPRRRRR